MTHREKVDFLVADLAKRGVSEYSSAPPAWRTAWGLGLKIPPPHFVAFLPMALTGGFIFGVLWGVAMHYILWRSFGWRYSTALGVAAGVFFGVCFAAYYRHSAAKLNLPSWEQYPAA